MMDFDEQFFFRLTSEDISTIFYQAKQQAEMILHSSACDGLTPDDAQIMATSFSIAILLLRRYHEAEQ